MPAETLLAAPRPPVAHAPATIDASWRQWIAENRLRDCTPDSMIDTMTANGLDADASRAAISAVEHDPVFLAARKHQQLQRKLESVMENLQRLWNSDPQYATIERRDHVELDEFVERYVRGCRPVVLTDVARNWPAIDRWTPSFMKAKFGGHTVEIQANRNSDAMYEPNKEAHRSRVQLAEFVDRMLAGGPTNDYYLTANNELMRNGPFASLLDDVGTLPELCDRNLLPVASSFWMGPAGTITSLHHDATMLFHTQVMGRKRWRFLSPLETPNLYNWNLYYSPIAIDRPDLSRFPRFTNATVIETVLEPGETIFLPLAWWHEVTSLEVSISFSYSNLRIPNEFHYRNAEITNWA
jgi:hypothetical protein